MKITNELHNTLHNSITGTQMDKIYKERFTVRCVYIAKEH